MQILVKISKDFLMKKARKKVLKKSYFSFDECGRRFMINTGKRRDVTNQFIK